MALTGISDLDLWIALIVRFFVVVHTSAHATQAIGDKVLVDGVDGDGLDHMKAHRSTSAIDFSLGHLKDVARVDNRCRMAHAAPDSPAGY